MSQQLITRNIELAIKTKTYTKKVRQQSEARRTTFSKQRTCRGAHFPLRLPRAHFSVQWPRRTGRVAHFSMQWPRRTGRGARLSAVAAALRARGAEQASASLQSQAAALTAQCRGIGAPGRRFHSLTQTS